MMKHPQEFHIGVAVRDDAASEQALEWALAEFGIPEALPHLLFTLIHVVSDVPNESGKLIRVSEAEPSAVAEHLSENVLPFLMRLQDFCDETEVTSSIEVVKNDLRPEAIMDAAARLSVGVLVLGGSPNTTTWGTIAYCTATGKQPPGCIAISIVNGRKHKEVSGTGELVSSQSFSPSSVLGVIESEAEGGGSSQSSFGSTPNGSAQMGTTGMLMGPSSLAPSTVSRRERWQNRNIGREEDALYYGGALHVDVDVAAMDGSVEGENSSPNLPRAHSPSGHPSTLSPSRQLGPGSELSRVSPRRLPPPLPTIISSPSRTPPESPQMSSMAAEVHPLNEEKSKLDEEVSGAKTDEPQENGERESDPTVGIEGERVEKVGAVKEAEEVERGESVEVDERRTEAADSVIELAASFADDQLREDNPQDAKEVQESSTTSGAPDAVSLESTQLAATDTSTAVEETVGEIQKKEGEAVGTIAVDESAEPQVEDSTTADEGECGLAEEATQGLEGGVLEDEKLKMKVVDIEEVSTNTESLGQGEAGEEREHAESSTSQEASSADVAVRDEEASVSNQGMEKGAEGEVSEIVVPEGVPGPSADNSLSLSSPEVTQAVTSEGGEDVFFDSVVSQGEGEPEQLDRKLSGVNIIDLSSGDEMPPVGEDGLTPLQRARLAYRAGNPHSGPSASSQSYSGEGSGDQGGGGKVEFALPPPSITRAAKMSGKLAAKANLPTSMGGRGKMDRKAKEEAEVAVGRAIRESMGQSNVPLMVPRVKTDFKVYTMKELQAAMDHFYPNHILGEGSYGIVYRGMLDGVDVAIKQLKNPEHNAAMEEIERELEVQKRCEHPNLVRLLGYSVEDRSLVYEYLCNGSLEDRLLCMGGSPPLLWPDRCRIAMEVAAALHHLHTRTPPIVHRDVKPANVLLDEHFVAKLGDVGLARLMADMQNGNTHIVRKSVIVGTEHYVDPEYLCARRGYLGPKSDVYSFGIVLLQLLVGGIPNLRKIDIAVEQDNLNSLLDPRAGDWPKGLVMDMANLGLWCSEMDRKDRPDLEEEVIPALLEICEGAAAEVMEQERRKDRAVEEARVREEALALAREEAVKLKEAEMKRLSDERVAQAAAAAAAAAEREAILNRASVKSLPGSPANRPALSSPPKPADSQKAAVHVKSNSVSSPAHAKAAVLQGPIPVASARAPPPPPAMEASGGCACVIL